MANEAEVFRERAAAEWVAAESATLDNVRERCERSARSWEAMARRSEQFLRSRQAAIALKMETST